MFASAPAVAVDDIVAAANAVETVSLGAPEEVVEVDSDEAYEPLEVPAGTPGPWAALFGGAGSANDADGRACPRTHKVLCACLTAPANVCPGCAARSAGAGPGS